MKTSSTFFFLPIILVFSIFSCKTNENEFEFSLVGTDLSVAEIAGTWEGSKAIFSSAGSGPALDVDIIEEGGYLVMHIMENGDFDLTYSVPGSFPVLTYGRLGFDEDLLVMEFEEDPDDLAFLGIVLDEPDLFLSGGPVYGAFDFDGDGIFDDAYIDFEFYRTD